MRTGGSDVLRYFEDSTQRAVGKACVLLRLGYRVLPEPKWLGRSFVAITGEGPKALNSVRSVLALGSRVDLFEIGLRRHR